MRGIGKFLLGSAAAITLVSGTVMLTTTEASAQFNIEGMIRGAIGHGYGGGGYRRHYAHHEYVSHGYRGYGRRGHASERDAKDDDSDSKASKSDSKDDAKAEAKADAKVDAKDDSGSDDRGSRKKPSAPPAQSADSAQPGKGASAPASDEPSFSPSR